MFSERSAIDERDPLGTGDAPDHADPNAGGVLASLLLLSDPGDEALVPEPSVEPFGLVPVPLAARLRRAAVAMPGDALYLVTHRALRTVRRAMSTGGPKSRSVPDTSR